MSATAGGPAPIERARPAREPKAGEGGYAAVLTALCLVIVLLFAGLAIDVGRWTQEGSRLQNVADSAAMAGAVFLPDRVDDARLAAEETIGAYGNEAVRVVDVSQGPRANQLRVTVEEEVTNAFSAVVGFDRTTVQRTAVAEYSAPVQMGSPESSLGNDPETGQRPDYWLAIAGPMANKQNGDRYASRFCRGAAQCTGDVNDEYDAEGYTFVVRVGPEAVNGPLRIQLFDPMFVNVGTRCERNVLPSEEQLEELVTRSGFFPGLPPGWYDDARSRYAGGRNEWCVGDNEVGGTDVETSVVVRAPDGTPWDDADNGIVDQPGCRPTTFPAFDTDDPDGLFTALDPLAADSAGEWVVDPGDGRWTLAEAWRRWVTVCEIPAGAAQTGDWLVQVTTSARASAPAVVDPSVSTAGQNFYSLRAGKATGAGLDGAGLSTFARGRLPIYANADGAETTLYTVRVEPGSAGRVLGIGFYDAGDAAAPGTLQVLPPVDSNVGSFSGCTFERADGATMGVVSPETCRVADVSMHTGFNGQLMQAFVPIPDDYDCEELSPDGCWVRVRLAFPAGVFDFTTWSASIGGSPVRLVE